MGHGALGKGSHTNESIGYIDTLDKLRAREQS
jgi:hypothetical protein